MDEQKNAYINRDKDMPKKRHNKQRRMHVKKFLKKHPGMKTRDKKDPDLVDITRDKDLKLSSSETERRTQMTEQMKTASLTNNVAEFYPGQLVVQVYPVARPITGVVTGSSRVEGKVYVSWNGRVAQHDPEEVQPLALTPFFTFPSRVASTENLAERLAESLVKASDRENGLIYDKLATVLATQGFDKDEAEKIAELYFSERNKKKASLAATGPLPLIPVSRQAVVILNDGGRRPGTVGIFVERVGNDAVVDVNTSWSTSRRDGSRLVKVPLFNVVPVDSPLVNTDNDCACMKKQGVCRCGEKLDTGTSLKARRAAIEMFCNMMKKIVLFKNDDCEATVTVNVSHDGESEKACVSVCGELRGKDNEVLCSKNIQLNIDGNKADFENSLKVVNEAVDTCKNMVLKRVRECFYPAYVVEDQKRFLRDNADELVK